MKETVKEDLQNMPAKNKTQNNHESMEEIIIETKHFGKATIKAEEIINFPAGILAFEQFTRYVILPEKKNLIFNWLQCLDEPQLAFLVMEPYNINPGYVPDIFAYDIENLFGSRDLEQLKVWCIVTIPPNHPEKMTVNLQGPLVISSEKRLGGQFISNNESHLVRTPVLEPAEAGVTS